MPKYFYLKYDMCDKNFAMTDATEQNSNFKVLHVDHMEDVRLVNKQTNKQTNKLVKGLSNHNPS